MYLSHKIEVFYEDTDSLGMVYHASYLMYAERVRSLWLRKYLRPDALTWLANNRIAFVVNELKIKYLKLAKLSDELIVDILPIKASHSRIVVNQFVFPSCSTNSAINTSETTQNLRPDLKPGDLNVSLEVTVSLINLNTGRPLAFQKKMPTFTNRLRQSILQNKNNTNRYFK